MCRYWSRPINLLSPAHNIHVLRLQDIVCMFYNMLQVTLKWLRGQKIALIALTTVMRWCLTKLPNFEKQYATQLQLLFLPHFSKRIAIIFFVWLLFKAHCTNSLSSGKLSMGYLSLQLAQTSKACAKLLQTFKTSIRQAQDCVLHKLACAAATTITFLNGETDTRVFEKVEYFRLPTFG